jgi:L,D-peptidoglycan transpeptidase YkuD (ErfK/YbiS/YcfS/YnhG family)
MIFQVTAGGVLQMPGRAAPCALGRSGVVAAAEKREGDGATPAGVWPLRRLFWRPDRRAPPVSRLPARPLSPTDGWCDDPAHGDYNRLVVLPHPASAERLWREDGVYDLLVTLGHNDDRVVAGAGSAIFLHLARPDFSPTEGCVALAADDMDRLLRIAAPGDALEILPPAWRG